MLIGWLPLVDDQQTVQATVQATHATSLNLGHNLTV